MCEPVEVAHPHHAYRHGYLRNQKIGKLKLWFSVRKLDSFLIIRKLARAVIRRLEAASVNPLGLTKTLVMC